MRIIIVEGARGTGKSTLCRALREKISEITLVNPTGFHLDNEEGLDKIRSYYSSWFKFLESTNNINMTIVFDRFFFTEKIFSDNYKSYDFTDAYDFFVNKLVDVADKIDIIFLKVDVESEDLQKRLNRDKVLFHNISENIYETQKQQDAYTKMFMDFSVKNMKENVDLHIIDTTNKTPNEVEKEVFEIVVGDINV